MSAFHESLEDFLGNFLSEGREQPVVDNRTNQS